MRTACSIVSAAICLLLRGIVPSLKQPAARLLVILL